MLLLKGISILKMYFKIWLENIVNVNKIFAEIWKDAKFMGGVTERDHEANRRISFLLYRHAAPV